MCLLVMRFVPRAEPTPGLAYGDDAHNAPRYHPACPYPHAWARTTHTRLCGPHPTGSTEVEDVSFDLFFRLAPR